MLNSNNIYYIMSSFAYLKCFNDLLLKKMERLEKENKELKEQKEKASRLERSYNSLVDSVKRGWSAEIVQCAKCDDWGHYGEMQYFWDAPYCDDCSQDYVKCCWCDNAFNLNDKVDKTLFIYDADCDCYCKDDEDCMEEYEKAMVRHWKDFYRHWKNEYDNVVKELNQLLLNKQFKIESNKITKLFIGVDVDENCKCGENIHKGLVKYQWRCELCDIDGSNYNGGLTDTESDTDSDAF